MAFAFAKSLVNPEVNEFTTDLIFEFPTGQLVVDFRNAETSLTVFFWFKPLPLAVEAELPDP